MVDTLEQLDGLTQLCDRARQRFIKDVPKAAELLKDDTIARAFMAGVVSLAMVIGDHTEQEQTNGR